MPSLFEVQETVHKKSVEGTMIKGVSSNRDFFRIPTGIFALDLAIGGGFPLGVSSSLFGAPSGGKSLVATRIATGVQNLCFGCLEYYWDCICDTDPTRKTPVLVQLEQGDMEWNEALGLDPNNVYLIEPDDGEEAIDVITKCMRADDCGGVFVDSLPMLTPVVELESSSSDAIMAAQAKLISRMMRVVKSLLIQAKKRKRRLLFLGINQLRAKIGGFGPQKEEASGCWAAKHDWHMTLRMSQIKSPTKDEKQKETGLASNALFKASLAAVGSKKKVFVTRGEAQFYVCLDAVGNLPKGTINDYNTVVKYAVDYGVLNKSDWSLFGHAAGTKTQLMEDWLDEQLFLSHKKKLVDYILQTIRDEQEAILA